MPFHQARYPSNWRTIASAYKERVGWRCEQCAVTHGTKRLSVQGRPYRVVITVAHLDRYDTLNPDARLVALCQVCHLAYDREDNLVRRRANRWQHRVRRLRRQGQLVLFAAEHETAALVQGNAAVGASVAEAG